MNQEKISSYQLGMILIGFFFGSAIAANNMLVSKQDTWLSFLIGWGAGFVLLFITIGIALLHPHKSLIGILIDCFGRTAGKIISLIYIAYFIILAGLITSNFSFYSTTTNYPETPILFFLICTIVASSFCLLGGLETLGRVSEVTMAITILNILFSIVLLIGVFRFEFLKPFLGNGIQPVLRSAFSSAMIPFSEVFVLLMVFPSVNNTGKAFRSSTWAFFIAGFLLLTVVLRNLMVLGSDFASREVFPTFVVFKMAPLPFSVEALFDFNAALAVIIKIAVYIFGASKGIAEVFGIQKYKKIIIPIAVAAMILAYYSQRTITDMTFVATRIIPITHLVFFVAFPCILFFVSLIRPMKAANGS